MTDEGPSDARRHGPRPLGLPLPAAVAAVVVGLTVGVGGPVLGRELLVDDSPVLATYEPAAVDRAAGELRTPTPRARDLSSYEGYGAWVDVFDFSPPYAGDTPPVGTGDIDAMAATGVRTIYLQGARLDDRTPDGLEDPWLLAEFLATAHAADIDVVGWYLPRWTADEADLERLQLLADFEVLGHRFDGVAVDIEYRSDGCRPRDPQRAARGPVGRPASRRGRPPRSARSCCRPC